MKKVYIEHLKNDMIVARTIYSSDGNILLNAGMILNETYIKRLEELKISFIYVKSHPLEDTNLPETISEEIRQATILMVKDSFNRIDKDRKLNAALIKELVNTIIDDILYNENIITGISHIMDFDNYTFSHSVNVCILALLTGVALEYTKPQLTELGTGALLHDIGKIKISKTILNKPDDLTKEEFEEIKCHTEYGFAILREYEDLSLEAGKISLEHHERWDGHGYPQRLIGLDIHEYSRITAVADVYDALLADRPYRPSYTINQAITIIKRMSDVYLDGRCVNALVSNIAIYPIGSILQLNTGDIGIVVDVNKNQPNRPIIRLLYDKYFRNLSINHEIDLSKYPTILIFKLLNENDFKFKLF